jgi:hypothetical protein
MIAVAMHARSRNAIVGKVYRLGLSRAPHVNGNSGQRPKRAPRRNGHKTLHYVDGRIFVVTGETSMLEELPVFANPKPFIKLRDSECRFPGVGEPGPDLPCCAAPAIDGKPYCLAHCRIAYVRPGARSRP